MGGSLVLIFLIGAAALAMARDHRSRENQAWIRSGQAGLALRLQGDQQLEQLGENALGFLAQYLDAPVGAVYLAQGDGHFKRFAGYAMAPGSNGDIVRTGDGLLGQAAKEISCCT